MSGAACDRILEMRERLVEGVEPQHQLADGMFFGFALSRKRLSEAQGALLAEQVRVLNTVVQAKRISLPEKLQLYQAVLSLAAGPELGEQLAQATAALLR